MESLEDKVMSHYKERVGSKKSGDSPPRRDINKATASADENEWKKKSDDWKAKIAGDYSKFKAPASTVRTLAESLTNIASSYYSSHIFNDAEESNTIEDYEHAMGFHERHDKMPKGMSWINEMRAKEGTIKSREGPWGFKLTKAVNPFSSSGNDLIGTISSEANVSNFIGTASNIIVPMKAKIVTIESDYSVKENNMDGGVSVILAVDEDANVIKSPRPSRYQIDQKFMGALDSDVATSEPWGLDTGAIDLDGCFPCYNRTSSFKNMSEAPIESKDDPMHFDDTLSAGSWASPWNRMGNGRKVGQDMDFKGLDLDVTLSAGSWASSDCEVAAEGMNFNDALSSKSWGPLWRTPRLNLAGNEHDNETISFINLLSAEALGSPNGEVVAIESDDEAMGVDDGLTSLCPTSSPLKRSLDYDLPSIIPAKRAKRSPLPGVGVPLSERPRDRKNLIKLLTVPRNKRFLDAFEKRHLEPFLKKPVTERIPDELKLQIFTDAVEKWFDEGKCFHVIANTNGFELSLWQGCRHFACTLPVGLQVNKLSRDLTLKIMFMRALKSDGLTHYVPSVAPFMYQGLSILDLDRKEMLIYEREAELSMEYRRYIAVQRLKALNLLADQNLAGEEN